MIVELTEEHLPALQAFFDALPDEDVTFVREDVRDPSTLATWVDSSRSGRRWLDVTDGTARGFLAVLPLVGWSAHVGEIRLVVHPGHRGKGIGAALARLAVEQAGPMHLSKLTVEVVAQQETTLRMFDRLGFEPEALLRDHIRDRGGELRDVVLLAYLLDEVSSAMIMSGVSDEVGREA